MLTTIKDISDKIALIKKIINDFIEKVDGPMSPTEKCYVRSFKNDLRQLKQQYTELVAEYKQQKTA